MDEMKFAMKEGDQLVQYLMEHPEITDVLFTGGDPMIMKAKIFSKYVDILIDAKLPNLKTIRIGTKSLSYWPYKFLTDSDSQEMLNIFRKVTDNGLHLAFMAHFNHLNELSTDSVKSAIKQVRSTGAEIRTQSPLLAHINDDSAIWAKMWSKQVQLGCIPYYMFVVRDTGAQHYFGVPLVKAFDIFRKAYSSVSGLARTVRGPSMSATPGKVHVIGTANIHDQKVIVLRFLQGRNPDWVQVPFFAKYDENAIWLDDLKPAFTENFFFDEEMKNIKAQSLNQNHPES
jgi:L-lysine 2,3-aminomutase